jgi:hypothetical protein
LTVNVSCTAVILYKEDASQLYVLSTQQLQRRRF